jgi:hypothetical protein
MIFKPTYLPTIFFFVMGPLFLKDLNRSVIFIPTYLPIFFGVLNGTPLFEGFKQVYDIHTYHFFFW